MKHGFIKVATAFNEIKVAEVNYNAERIIEIIKEAESKKVKLLIFQGLSLTGCTLGDLYTQDVLTEEIKEAVSEILYKTEEIDCVAVFSLPLFLSGKMFLASLAIHKGEILGFVPKTNLTKIEKRVFTAALPKVTEIEFNGKRYPFGKDIIFRCENLESFTFGIEMGEDLLSPVPPSANLALSGANIILNPATFPEVIGMNEKIKNAVKEASKRLSCAYMIANPGFGESTGDMVFSGYSLISENGKVLGENKAFSKGLNITELDLDYISKIRIKREDFPLLLNENLKEVYFAIEKEETTLSRKIEKNPFVPCDDKKRDEICQRILDIQSEGLKKRILHTGAKCVVLGISGGLDSCLALLAADLTMKKLSRENKDILAITMPCFGTTKRTKGNAEKLCEILKTSFKTIDIKDSVQKHFSDIDHDEEIKDAVYENSQARERTQVLMDMANKEKGLVIGTGDLSELALGWATYNGDHMSMYGLNASVPKTLVKEIVSYVAEKSENDELKKVLEDIVNTPVSPELIPAEGQEISQKTEELVGPYCLHDFFLYYTVKYGFTPEKIKRLANYAFDGEYDEKTIDYWNKTFVKRFFSQQFKRSCLPEGPKVGSVNLSPRGEFSMPGDACAGLWLK